jgi:hypothetical protein
VEKTRIATAFGDIEYAERGTGEPLLVSHGIFQGCASALLFCGLFAGRRVIADPVKDSRHRLRWSAWRWRRQHQARTCHYQRQARQL